MAMVMAKVNFSSALDVLNASSRHCNTPFHTQGPSFARVRGLGIRELRNWRIGLVERRTGKFEELVGRRRIRSWCVRAESVSELRSAENLRAELEALQREFEQVRSKAKSARLRFMRLTHVVEQLRQRAAVDLRMGKDDTARGLLLEKQKVMKALEAARQRAELLEQLAAKLNVAISMKETLLIAALSSAPVGVRSEGDDTAVHHVSPRTEGLEEEMTQSGVGEVDISSRAGLNSDRDLNLSN